MTGAAIDRELNNYINRLNAAQKKSLLGFIKTIFTSVENSYTIEQYNQELEVADTAIAQGEYSLNEDVFAESKKLLNAKKKSQVG